MECTFHEPDVHHPTRKRADFCMVFLGGKTKRYKPRLFRMMNAPLPRKSRLPHFCICLTLGSESCPLR
jgi:hypothetical protein